MPTAPDPVFRLRDPDPAEWAEKSATLSDWLGRHGLDAVVLWQRPNFAWATGGHDNHVYNASADGVAGVLVDVDGNRTCLCDTIESPRFREEELAGTGIDVIDYPWHDLAAKQAAVRDALAGRRVAADLDPLGLDHAPLPGDFRELRLTLTPAERQRYADAGAAAGAAIGRAARRLERGMTEHDAAAILDAEVRHGGLTPTLALIATGDRARRYRHPIPTHTPLSEATMLVTCNSGGGLISNVTRMVHFGDLPQDLADRHAAVCRVDTKVNAATQPGRTLGEIFADLQAVYAAEGYPDEWHHHHQGGPTGYLGRESFAVPNDDTLVLEHQAFAWNPSIAGTKSEDTYLGGQPLTSTINWPQAEGRPGVLVL